MQDYQIIKLYRKEDQTSVFTIIGDFTGINAIQIKSDILKDIENVNSQIEINLNHCSKLDLTGLNAVLMVKRRMQLHNGNLDVLIQKDHHNYRLLEQTKATELLTLRA